MGRWRGGRRSASARAVALCAAMASAGLGAQPATVTFSAGAVEGPGWRARDVVVTYVSHSDLQLEAAAVEWASTAAVKDLRVHCAGPQPGTGLRCDRGRFSARVPVWGALQGLVKADFDHPARWHAEIEVPRRGLVAVLNQAAGQLDVSASARGQAAEDLRRLAAVLGLASPGAFAGTVDVKLTAALAPAHSAGTLEVDTASLTYSEPSGRYAAEKLAARAVVRWRAAAQRWEVELDARGGQAYAEPLFLDFSALPLQARAVATGSREHWRIERLHVRQGAAGTLEATARIARRDLRLERAQIAFEAAELAPLVTTDLQPFLIGTPLADLGAAGQARGTLSLRDGRLTELAADISNGAIAAPRWGLALKGVSGQVRWSAGEARPSALRWSEGTALRVPFGPSAIAFRSRGRDVELLQPWRQPLLDGALQVERLAVRGLGALPRVTADVRARRLDLRTLTAAFSLGRITGRLDGDVDGLRLLDWRPVAFDARLHSTPGDTSGRHISQRAIDMLSSIGGGPTGLLSRGFLGLFQEFAYDRIGIRCVLRDGRCAMDGIGPARSKDGRDGYYLVKGRLLPRVDVVGYARDVSWDSLVGQLEAARASDGPQTR